MKNIFEKHLTENRLAVALFLIALATYLKTLAPGLTFTDSGELAAVCTTLGVAHPTGYPLFTILGYLWSLLPLSGTPIHQMNLMAAFLVAVSVPLFFKICLLLLDQFPNEPKAEKGKKSSRQKKAQLAPEPTGRPVKLLVAAATALTYAWAATIWNQATAIEVYSLHLVLMLLTIQLVTGGLFAERPARKKLIGGALVLGLSMSNHMTSVLLIPGLLTLYFLKSGFSKKSFGLLGLISGAFLVGLLFYLYLPLRSAAGPLFNWGEVSRGWDKFIYHVTGRQYQVWMFTGGWGERLKDFLIGCPNRLTLLSLLLLLPGFWLTLVKRREIFFFLILLLIFCVGYAVNYGIHDVEAYFVQAVAASLWIIGICFFILIRQVNTRPLLLAFLLLTCVGYLVSGSYHDFLDFHKETIFFLLLSAICFIVLRSQVKKRPLVLACCLFALPLSNLALNHQAVDRSNERLVENYTRNLIDNLEPNSIIISAQWDYFCSAFWYLQQVEGYRPDVVMIEKELLRRTWYYDQLKRWHPEVYQTSANEIDNFLLDLEKFESGQQYSRDRIQSRFVAMLNSFIDKSFENRPIYITGEVLQAEPKVAATYKKIPKGLAFRIVAKGDYSFYPTEYDLDDLLNSSVNKHHNLHHGLAELTSKNIKLVSDYARTNGREEQADTLFKLYRRVQMKHVHICGRLKKNIGFRK